MFLKGLLQALPGVEEIIDQKTGITYKTTKSFAKVKFGKTFIRVLVRSFKYYDPDKMIKNIKGYLWGYEGTMRIDSVQDIEKAFNIIKQSYEETL